MSTSSPKKSTGGDKGAPIFAVRERLMAPLFGHVSGVVLDLFFLGNAFFQWGKSVTGSKEGKLQGLNLFFHFYRENFEGLEQTRGYLSHNMRVMRFRYNSLKMLSMVLKLSWDLSMV